MRRAICYLVTIVLTVLSGTSAEESWGRIRVPSITLPQDRSVVQKLDTVANAVGCTLYFEVNAEDVQRLMGPPAVPEKTVLRGGSFDFVLGQLQASVVRHLLLNTEGSALVAVPTTPTPLSEKSIDFDFEGTTAEFVEILYKQGGITLFRREGVYDLHIGDLERMRITGDARGRVKGRLTIRAALVRFIQSANLNVTVTVEKGRSVDFYFWQMAPSALRKSQE